MACERGETSTNVKRILPRQSLCTVVLVVSTMSACSSPARVPDKAEAIRNGDALAQKGQYVQAAAAYRMAVGVDPTDGELRMKLANTYWSAENWGEATLQAVRAADLVRGTSAAEILAASFLLPQELYREAFEHASAAVKQEPENVVALIIIGNAKAHLQSSTIALLKINDAVSRGGDYKPWPGQVRGVVLRRDDEEAESAFRKALRLAPNNNAARMSLANFLWAAGRADEGEEPLRQWADVSSEALPKRILGRFCVSRGRIAEGEQYLKVAAATGDRERPS